MKTFAEALEVFMKFDPVHSPEELRQKVEVLRDEITGSHDARGFLKALTAVGILGGGELTVEDMTQKVAFMAFVAGVVVGYEMRETHETAYRT